jgi:hypothetical protein
MNGRGLRDGRLPYEAGASHFEEKLVALDRDLREERRKAGLVTEMSARMGLVELTRDPKVALIFNLTDRASRRSEGAKALRDGFESLR